MNQEGEKSFESDDEENEEKVDDGHWFQLLDRTHLLYKFSEEHISSNPVLKQNSALNDMVDEIESKIFHLYQEIGSIMPIKE